MADGKLFKVFHDVVFAKLNKTLHIVDFMVMVVCWAIYRSKITNQITQLCIHPDPSIIKFCGNGGVKIKYSGPRFVIL